MLIGAWKKIDKFYIILAVVVLVLAVPFVLTAQGVFSSLISAYEIDSESDRPVSINKSQLQKALEVYNESEVPALEVRSPAFVVVE